MNHLQFLRLQKELSQKQLATLIGVHPAVLNRIEKGWCARIPSRVEQGLRDFFGEEWTFERLMKKVDYNPQ